MRFSKRIENLAPYLFVNINQKIASKRQRGETIINFGAGDPDLPTPGPLVAELCRAAIDPANHRYPETAGIPELRQAIAEWYQRRFAVCLDPDTEVVPLIGAKEGIFHIAFCLIDEGDIALVPDPGYPVYSTGTILAGGQNYFMALNDRNGYLPELEKVPQQIVNRSRVIWLNYPNNPTGAVAGLEYFERAVEFARRNDIIVCHDAPYTEVAYDGYQPVSFLQAGSARDIGIEFHSFSKTYNMAGWRIGMAVGNARIINALKRFKSNVDSGIPRAIQLMGARAMAQPLESKFERNLIYQQRRDKLVAVLNYIGLTAHSPRAGLYVWARCPAGWRSTDFAAELLERAGVVVTPGIGYGPGGDDHVRFSLTLADEDLEKGLERLKIWHKTR